MSFHLEYEIFFKIWTRFTLANLCTLRAAEDTGKFANKRFNEKNKEYGECADANRFGFLPIILESNGLMHPKSKEFFYKLAKDCSEIKRIDICILFKYYLKRISVCLQKNLSRCRLTKLAMIKSHSNLSVVDPSLDYDANSWEWVCGYLLLCINICIITINKHKYSSMS